MSADRSWGAGRVQAQGDERYDVVAFRNIMVTVRDGIDLATDA